MSNLRVLISGASIAGPTAAYWFARAGAHVTVIERFPALRTNGHNIDIRTAGVTVMRKMDGMEAAVRARFTQLDGICLVDTYGRPFATMRATGDPNAQSLVSEYEIFRGDLARILYDMTVSHANIRYVFGEQVSSITPSANSDEPAHVTFANGNLPSADYDLIVAADGAASRTRAIGLQCGVYDHVLRLNSWTAYFSTPRDFLNGTKMGHGYSAVPGRFVAAGPDPFTGMNRIMMTGIVPRHRVEAIASFREANARGEAALKQYIAGQFRGMGWRTDEMLEAMMEADDLYASELLQVKLPHLSNGRFVLIGDAGCAPGPTGSGTSLALASAYVLAGEMARANGNVRSGLRAYEERMRPIVSDMQKIPPGVPGIMAPQTEWGLAVRNGLLRAGSAVMGWGVSEYVSGWVGRLFASSFGGDKYGLPEYEWVERRGESAQIANAT